MNRTLGLRRREALAALLAAAVARPARAGGILGVGVSSPGSVFHSAGSAMAIVANERGDLPMTVQAFASPNVYLPSVNVGEIAFGVSNVGDVRLAAVGEMHFEGRALQNLRAVAVMFPLPMAIYVRTNSSIRSVEDLRGLRMPTGFAGQKTLRPLFDAMLATGGLTTDDIDQIQVPDVVGGANAFMEGKADAFFFALGAAKVREADAAVDGGVRAISLPNTPEALAAIKAIWPVGYLLGAAPGPASPGVREPIYTLTHDAIVAASTYTADEDVYRLVRTVHDNRPALQAAFAPFGRLDPDRMLVDIPGVEWHPGARRYYDEIGQEPQGEPGTDAAD
jgi:TRAP transporter TAXI family solute receptor